MTDDDMREMLAVVADRIQERMGPLFGSPEYLADPVKLARAQKRQRDSAESWAEIAAEEAMRAVRAATIEECARACEEQSAVFASNEYANPQPVGSLMERFACKECATAIRALSKGQGE